MFSLEFTDPLHRLPGENRSKLLDPKAPLTRVLDAARVRIASRYKVDATRPFHVEIMWGDLSRLDRGRRDAIFVERAQYVQGRQIDVVGASHLVGRTPLRAFAIDVGTASPRHGQVVHITVAYCVQELGAPELEWMREQVAAAVLEEQKSS